MDLNFEEAKREYQSIEIPEELDEMVNKTINKVNGQRINSKGTHRVLKISIAAMLLFCSSFLLGVNTSKVFAESVASIPIIGELAHLVTFRDYEVQNNLIKADIKIPAIEGISDNKLAKQINDEIYTKMTDRLEDAKTRAKEYKKAYLATGGIEENYRPIIVKIDYELKSVNKNIISFTVFQFESLASSYAKTYYYNIDFENNKLLTLQDILGENCKAIIDASVNVQIEERKKDSANSYFEGDIGFKGIKDGQNFYINENGKVVVVFNKYEIAPGYMGEQEFIIENDVIKQ